VGASWRLSCANEFASVHLAFLLHRNWRVLRAAGKSGGVDAILVLRTLVFGLYIAAGMACVSRLLLCGITLTP
jgi:hypothetical protein